MNESKEPGRFRFQVITILRVTGWAVLTFIVAYGLTISAIAAIKAMSPTFFGLSQNVLLVAVSTVLYALMLACLLFLPRVVGRRLATSTVLGVQRGIVWKDIGLALPAIAVYFLSTTAMLNLASRFFPWFDTDQVQETGFSSFVSGNELAWIFLLLVIVGPIVEEVIFRGYLYGKIRAAKVPFWPTAVIVSVLFGLAHMQWNVGVDTFVLSMVMCLARELTGSIWTGVLVHMMKNGLAFYLLFIATDVLPALSALIF